MNNTEEIVTDEEVYKPSEFETRLEDILKDAIKLGKYSSFQKMSLIKLFTSNAGKAYLKTWAD